MQYKYQEEEKEQSTSESTRASYSTNTQCATVGVSINIRHWIPTRRPTERDESDDAHDTPSRVAEGDATMTTKNANETCYS